MLYKVNVGPQRKRKLQKKRSEVPSTTQRIRQGPISLLSGKEWVSVRWVVCTGSKKRRNEM